MKWDLERISDGPILNSYLMYGSTFSSYVEKYVANEITNVSVRSTIF